ncbi:MAG: ATP-binding protein [Candidatus Omnitrophota bacterium]
MRRNKTEHFIIKKVGIAVNRYRMISGGDKVLVAVSGGKDSLVLLKVLQERKKHLPIDYTLKAVHISTDYDSSPQINKKKLIEFFESIGCEYIFKKIAIAKKNKLGKEDCFWCSWNRRKALFETADELGFTKIAFGHHKDDIVETILMNMIWNGELSGINPVQSLFKGKIIVIRPLVLLEEKDIADYAGSVGLAAIKSTCPRNYDSTRAVIKEVVKRLAKESPDIKTNIIKAPHRIKQDYLFDITDPTG